MIQHRDNFHDYIYTEYKLRVLATVLGLLTDVKMSEAEEKLEVV